MISMIMRSSLETARDYAAVDLAVFPVGWDCKTPLTPHGCKDASNDPAEIERLWAGRISVNVAVATGAPSGVFVLDVDTKAGKDGFAALAALQARHGPLPPTWRSRTPSGGAHLYFVQPTDRNLRNRVNLAVYGFDKSGLDVRSTGASVALPPSRRPDGAYSWEVDPLTVRPADSPDWLLDLIDPRTQVRPPRAPLQFQSIDRMAFYVAAAVNRECADTARTAAGGRNQRLFRAAATLGEFVGAGLLFQGLAEGALEQAADECGLVLDDGMAAVRATIASGMARGIERPREVWA